MTRSPGAGPARRGWLAAALLTAALAVAFVSGCSAGQLTQTAEQVSSVPGVNAQLDLPGGFQLAVRNVLVEYGGPQGYPRGASAAVEARIFNDTATPVTVRISSPAAARVVVTGPAPSAPPSPAAPPPASASPPAASASPATPSPAAPPPASTPSPAAPSPAAPAAPAGAPAEIQVPAFGFAAFGSGAVRQLHLVGLHQPLGAGQSVRLIFDFGAAGALPVEIPVAPPLTPGPRSPIVFEPGTAEGHG